MPAPPRPACPHCGGELIDITVTVDLTPVTARLDRTERAVRRLSTRLEQIMSELDDKLTTLEGDEAAEATSLTALEADEARELADLQALKNAGASLTAAQEQRLADLDAAMQAQKARVDAADAAIDAVDPAPEPAP